MQGSNFGPEKFERVQYQVLAPAYSKYFEMFVKIEIQ